MGLLQRLFGRRRPDPAEHLRFIPPIPESGIRLTADEALSLSAVWACIDAIAKAIASCKWNVFIPIGNGRKQLLEDDPIAWLLNTRPNPEMTAIAFRESLLYTAIPFGNAYAEIVPDRAGRPAQLWPLEHWRVRPRRTDANELVYDYLQPDGQVVTLDASQVFHLRGPSISGLLGDNLIARAARSLAAAAAAERFATSFFGNSAQPSAIIKHPSKMSAQAHENLRKDIDEKRKNKHSTIILEEGAEWISVTTEPQKTQLVETRQFSVEEICRWFGVPPHKVQHLLRSTYSNIEHQSIEFVRDALAPWCRRLEQEADYKLFSQRRPRRESSIDTAPLSYGDATSRASAHAIWRQNGIMTANEIRAREGLNDAGPDGDVLLVQANLTTVQNILAAGPASGDDKYDPEVPDDDVTEGELVEASAPKQIGDGSAAVAMEALRVFLSSALDRYIRRLANRRADLERRHGPEEVRAKLDEERQRLGPWLVSELAPADSMAQRALGRSLTADEIQRAAALVDQGQSPATAAFVVLSTPHGKLAA